MLSDKGLPNFIGGWIAPQGHSRYRVGEECNQQPWVDSKPFLVGIDRANDQSQGQSNNKPFVDPRGKQNGQNSCGSMG